MFPFDPSQQSNVNPPYLLREHGVFIRVGDQDRHATVRDLQALCDRRARTIAPPPSPWNEVLNRIFAFLPALDSALPPVLAVALTPTFPIPSVILNPGTDAVFADILREGLGENEPPFLEPRGVSYVPEPDPPRLIVQQPHAPSRRAQSVCDGLWIFRSLTTEIGDKLMSSDSGGI
jgi:hypothetical protein